jgi:hypothetical protein
MKKINRNAWSATEMDTLISVVKESKTPSIGCKKAANLLGRTALGCTYKYYQYMRNQKAGIKTNVKSQLEGNTELSFKIKSVKIANGYLTVEI